MFLSELLNQYGKEKDYEIINEKPFKYLALTAFTLEESTCVFVQDMKFARQIPACATMIITTEEIYETLKERQNMGFCICNNPKLLFFKLHNFLASDAEYTLPKYKTQIGENCKISPLAVIAENNVIIGNNVTIEEFVTIRENTSIGDDVIIRAGTRIGQDPLYTAGNGDEKIHIIHLGSVIVGNAVQIGVNSVIDKAAFTFDQTLIDDFVHVDALVSIGHGAKIGKSSNITSGVSICGRVQTGVHCHFAPRSLISNGIRLGDNVSVTLGSVVVENVKSGKTVTGNFSMDHQDFLVDFSERKRNARAKNKQRKQSGEHNAI